MSFLDGFDASNVKPQQGFDSHPPGMFDAQISHTYLKPTKDNNGLLFNVEFTTPAGKIEKRYNVYNNNAMAVEIAQKELSALCHAVGIFKVTNPKNPDGSPIFDQAGRELRGARCRIEVAPQTNKDGSPSGYMDVKKVYDAQGNEPGKQTGQPQPKQNQDANPNVQSSWNNGAAPVPTQQPTQNGPQWGNTPNPQAAQNNNPNSSPGAWSGGQQTTQQPTQNAPGGGKPPWAQ